ncbi:AraC family transcriptional regulator [Sedimentimonas flavescens]|uniref:AraC family transcriptional regulator n=1 Tax=Sedimentimonas flavescens TaxID=2851012 RepID=A0ABT3A303_9RHOB|nr:AraC family transcriptional regulator [Sedimentimonas flavescens]MCV2880318.1 AraC family transcriptional regulator [Sedimentimonas flavescens]
MSGIVGGVSFDLATRELSAVAGLECLRELFDTKVQLTFDASADQRVDAQMTVHGLPGLRRARMTSTMDVHLGRKRPMLADGQDDVCLIIGTGGQLAIDQRARRSVAREGDAVLLVYREPAEVHFHSMNYLSVRVPYSALVPLTKDLEAAAGRCVPREATALALLRSYVSALPAHMADLRLSGLIATHVYDLMALAIGSNADGRELALGRGVRVARLKAIEADLARDSTLSLEEIARRQNVTPRYVQMLFEDAGTTFTSYVLDIRLEAVRTMLISPRYKDWSVTNIALEAGFGDISYFNRRFRRRFSMTPTDLRNAAQQVR